MHFILGFCALVACFALFPRTAYLFGAILGIGFVLFVIAGLLGAFN